MTGFDVLADVLRRFRQLMVPAFFVGGAVWLTCSTLYYLAERHNPKMVYCPSGRVRLPCPAALPGCRAPLPCRLPSRSRAPLALS